jgi:hypothetical protein
MARTSRKRPRARVLPTARKEPRTSPGRDPALHDRETIVWRFSVVDQGGDWGWRSLAARFWWSEVLPKLQAFESMTWAEIMAAAGGRSRGTNSHPVDVARLSRRAKARLAEIQQEDVSELFSLRLTATTRIYGIRDRRALKLLWYDPHHGTNAQAVYPVRNR